MTSIDHRDAQVQSYFTQMKKAPYDNNKIEIAEQLGKMYEKSDDYSYGIFSRIYKFISQSNDKEDKKVGLIVLAQVGQKMQGLARSAFVNKFHSPTFKLFENNQDENLIQYLQKAYQVILQIGGNRNDSVIESNLNSSLSILSTNAKDIRKVSAYAILKILVVHSPYITFKKILQKQKQIIDDNLSLIVNVSKSRNIRIRKAYLSFIDEYIQYIAQKKDQNFQKQMFQRLVQNAFNVNSKQYKQNNQEYVHLYLETVSIFLLHLTNIVGKQNINTIARFVVEKIASNKNLVIQKSLINIIPLLVGKNIDQSLMSVCLSYLRQIKGDDQIIAQNAINNILESYHKNKEDYLEVYKSILAQINYSFKQNIANHQKNHEFKHNLAQMQVKTIHTLIKCHTSMNYSQLISKQALQQLASFAILIRLDQTTLKLIHQISKQNIHDLSQILQKKLILVITKILTGTTKKIMRDPPPEFKKFIQYLEGIYIQDQVQIQDNKIRAIQTLSHYRFKQEFRDIVGGFVRDKVLKYYLQWGNGSMRKASVQVAFFLCAKKGKIIAAGQMLQILQKLIRVGLTDNQQTVREKVFFSIQHNLIKQQDFSNFFSNVSLLNSLFQTTQDRNQKIRLTSLKILCILYKKNPSALIIPFLKKIAYNCFYHFSSNFKYYHQKKYWIKSFSILIEHASFIIKNHVNALLQLLLRYLEDRNNYQGLQIIFFQMFKILTQSLPDSLLPYVQKICFYLIQAMKDKLNTKKRNLALKTFVSIIKNCGYVVVPYYQVANLEQTLIYLLRSQIQSESRNDLMRILGGLGIIDKYKPKRQILAPTEEEDSQYKHIIKNSNFNARKQSLQIKNLSNKCDEQLKIYYDELILLQNNSSKELSFFKDPRFTDFLLNYKKQKDFKSIQLVVDSMTNFNMIVLKNLFDILGDVSLTQKHQLTIDVLSQVLQMLGSQIQSEVQKILPYLLYLAESNQQILNLVIIIAQKCDISSQVSIILQSVLYKCKNSTIIIQIFDILSSKFKQSLRHFLQYLVDKLYTLIQQNLGDQDVLIKIIMIYRNLKYLLQPYLSTVIPQFLDKFFRQHSPVTNSLIQFIMVMTKHCSSLIQFMPQIIFYYSQLLKSCHNKHAQCKPCLRTKICNSVVIFIIQYGQQFLPYLPLIHKSIIKCQQRHELYTKAISKLDHCYLGSIQFEFTYEQLEKLSVEYKSPSFNKFQMPKYARKVQGTEELIHQFDPLGKKLMDTDWIEWLKKTSIFLLKKSPNIILRACSDLAQQYSQLGLQFYNVSFYYFWEILLDQQKKIIIDNIKKILLAYPKPFLLVRKVILNLAQFMNRKKCSFQINSSLLADCARQSSSFAKHLYYRQLEFEVIPDKTIQRLIEVSMKLGQPENAFGLFQVASNLGIKCKIQWYQKIGKYEEAYIAYQNSNDPQYNLSKLKCLSQINDEKFLQEINQTILKQNTQISELAASSYANLQQWALVQQCCESLDQQSESKNFWLSVVNVKKQHYSKSISCITKTRKLIYQEISQLINFSYSGEPVQKLFRLQQLFQLQQIINLKLQQKKLNEQIKNFPQNEQTLKLQEAYEQKVYRIKQIWNDRLIGCSKRQSNWSKLTYIRSILFQKVQYFDFYYEYCEICIKEKKINKFQRMISELKRGLSKMDKNFKKNQQFLQGKLQLLEILQIQSNFVQQLITSEEQIFKIVSFIDKNKNINTKKISQIYNLCAKSLFDKSDNASQFTLNKVIELYVKSTDLYKSTKSLSMLGLMHLQAVTVFKNNQENQKKIKYHIFQALKAFISSLEYTELSNELVLQGFLKLLSLLCNYSYLDEIYQYFMSEYKRIPVQGWINVVPQMIAQLIEFDKQENFTKILKNILIHLGFKHPESLLFSLNFAVKCKIPQRVKPALQIMQKIKQNHYQLTQQIQTISNQLGKAAIKLKQFWYDGIEAAWSTYNQVKNSKQVVELLKTLCQQVLQRRQSNSQLSFHQQFQHQIRQGYSWVLRYQRFNDPASLSQAFQIFYAIYRKVKDSFENLKKVYLKNVSPSLVSSKSYQTTIPGMYYPGKEKIKISGFGNQLSVLQSKQRPRKLTIYGDNGKSYNFLLKGRQDLRLDERVMQFFSLVNKLLGSERQLLKKDLSITKYSIIPLTLNTGLIGWVQNCDTLNDLIKEYRQMNKIRMYVEKELYQKMCSQYAYLPMINKLQIFKNGLDSTQGKDLLKILWLKSTNCESWVQRRNNYTTSLATMSMVGYILGLGDRHPSNIMIKRDSGKIVHIDFGDCFQVAVLRQKFPQRVPFRLTRMLQKAMGVAGINGIYRSTCQKVMKILRDNKQSLLSVLQTFAHDPIISWRITTDKKENDENQQQKQEMNPFPEKKNNNPDNELIGSIMNGLQSQLNQQKVKDNDQVLVPKNISMNSPIRRHHEPNLANNPNINQKAIKALTRIKMKFKGRDFNEKVVLTVEEQVSKLIQQAISHQNICQSWPGWCPFW